MAKIIQHQLFYPNPPQAVWDYLTVPELMKQWLMPTNFEPVFGARVSIYNQTYG